MIFFTRFKLIVLFVKKKGNENFKFKKNKKK